MKPDCVVIVFAKAPVPGLVKTRLAKKIGEERAARLAARMLDETLQQAVAAKVGAVELCCTPDGSAQEFKRAQETYPIHLTLQGEGDLGERMRRACERALKNYKSVLLIGTDVPQLQPQHLRDAAKALASHDAAFIPVNDGGYYLVGLRKTDHLQADRMPFDDIAWSSSHVMQKTRDNLIKLGLRWTELPALNDVDEPEDLVHVPTEWLA